MYTDFVEGSVAASTLSGTPYLWGLSNDVGTE